MDGESGFNPSISDEIQSWDIQVDKTEGTRGVTRSIIDELHSSAIQGDQI